MAVALRTPRLLLREWRDDDYDVFAAICTEPEVMRYYPPKPDRAAATDAWVTRMRAHNEAHGFAYWAVDLPGTGVIGAVGMTRVSTLPFAPAVEIGWRVARARWGRGYATEAARAGLDDGFGRLGFDEIVAYTVPANQRSRRVMERLGMTHDPHDDFDHPRLPEGDPLRRHVLYRLRRSGA